jgi:bacteriocin resistance YdeI/OmpD-like protein/uncharacterized protein DUF1801
MGTRDPRIDAYIAKSADFAKPILIHLRELVHGACPGVAEDIKWSTPSFMYKGPLCGMAAFKQHATFGFWKHDLVTGSPRDGMGFGRLTKVSELPPKKTLAAFVKKAAALNEQGVKVERPRKAPKAPAKAPTDLLAALKKNAAARATYDAFSPSAKREYVEWITGAKTDETRAKRLKTAVEWMADGKHRNWKYL